MAPVGRLTEVQEQAPPMRQRHRRVIGERRQVSAQRFQVEATIKGFDPGAVPNHPKPASSARDDVSKPSPDSLPVIQDRRSFPLQQTAADAATH